MRERVWGSPDVGRAPGCVRTQGTLPGSIWKRGMWRGVATQVRTHRTHGTQEMRRLRQDATPTDQTQGPFLLMCPLSWHLTAKTPPPGGTQLLPPLWLAPYCYSPTSTLLLTFLAGIRSAWWLRSPSSPSDHVTLPRLRLVVV